MLAKTPACWFRGMSGREGTFQTERCIAFGTSVVAGVTPGRGGTTHIDRPMYDSVAEAVEQEGANVSLIFVPAAFATDALLEAADGGVELIVCITDGVPTLDMAQVAQYLVKKGVRLIGPNCPGLTSVAERQKVGIIPGNIHTEGRIGVISRSGTLTYEAVSQLTALGIGQSTCVGVGGDPIIGMRHRDILELFENDPDTDAVVLIGEIGGTGRAGSRGLYQEPHEQAGDGVHRGRDCASRTPHGPRGRDHHGHGGDGGGQETGPARCRLLRVGQPGADRHHRAAHVDGEAHLELICRPALVCILVAVIKFTI